jgi:hypothetical protein
MNDDRLKQLLENTDLSAPSPKGHAELAQNVFRMARRRAIARQSIRLCGAAIIAGLAAWIVWTKPRPNIAIDSRKPVNGHPTLVASEVAHVKVELAELDAQASLHERTAKVFLQLSRADRRKIHADSERALLMTQDPQARVDEQRELTAYIIIERGDRLLRQSNDESAAAAAYRRAIELFPDSAQASVARQRLEHIGT